MLKQLNTESYLDSDLVKLIKINLIFVQEYKHCTSCNRSKSAFLYFYCIFIISLIIQIPAYNSSDSVFDAVTGTDELTVLFQSWTKIPTFSL